jgi:hypothetical protein
MVEKINWKDSSRFDKSRLSVDIRMLDECGLEVTKECFKAGDKLSDDKVLRTIVYDRDYIIYKSSLNNKSLLKLDKSKYLALQADIWEWNNSNA